MYICIYILIFCCCFVQVAFAAADSVFSFRLLDYGMPKADIAMLSPVLMVIGIALPAYMNDVVATRPLKVFIQGVFCKAITSGLLWACGQYAKSYYASPSDHDSYLFFGVIFFTMILHEAAGTLIFVAMMSFFSTVSDPKIGGTYMTLLNTLSNLGHKWPTSLALFVLPKVSSYSCSILNGSKDGQTATQTATQACSGLKDVACTAAGGICQVELDGYTVLTACCIVCGGLWYLMFRSAIVRLEKTPLEEWRITLSAGSNPQGGATGAKEMEKNGSVKLYPKDN